MKPCKLQKELPAPREALIKAGKISVKKERKVKNACG